VDIANPNSWSCSKRAYSATQIATFRRRRIPEQQLDVGPSCMAVSGAYEDQFDVVPAATFTDGTNVPRIPPVTRRRRRLLARHNWFMRVNLLHAFAQNDIAVIARRRRRL